MATYASGSIHFSGLGSDTDFDSMITGLKQIESRYAKQLMRWKSDWRTRSDAFKEVRVSLLSMQSAMQKVNSIDKFLVKTVSSSYASALTATISNKAEAGSYTLNVEQVAKPSVWTKETNITDKNAPVTAGDGGGGFIAGSLSYVYKGTEHTIAVPPGTSLEGLKNIINGDAGNLGVKASIISNGSSYIFQLRGEESGTDAFLEITDTQNLEGFNRTWLSIGTEVALATKEFSSATDSINTTGSNQIFSFSHNNSRYEVTVHPGDTLQDLVTTIGTVSGMDAGLVAGTGSTVMLKLSGKNVGDTVTINDTTTVDGFIPNGKPWQFQAGKNAKFTLDGMPIETASNTVSDIIDGVTFNLRSEGIATINIDIDTQKIQENVENFINAVNETRTLLKSLTEVDDNKETLDLEYAESQFEMQKGGVLTGNYGIQLIASRLKSAVSGGAKGFMPKLSPFDAFGDTFSSLSQIGIITNSDPASDNFGLLELRLDAGDLGNTNTEFMTFTDALAQDPIAVARLFSANGDGKALFPPPFTGEKITADTKEGLYDVVYDVDSSGQVTGTINGKTARYNSATQTLFLDSTDGSANNADGLSLYINRVAQGSYSGNARVNGGNIYTAVSAGFSYSSNVVGITKPGIYDVAYEVDSGGAIIDGTATINGKPAKYDPDTNQLSLSRSENDINDADGIVLLINNFSAGEHSGQVAIQQGKVGEVLGLLTGGKTRDTAGILDREFGSLSILETRYEEIMNNITDKIHKEDIRLQKWESRMRLRFARLEAVLVRYNGVKSDLESQVQQLSGSSGK